MTNNYLQKLLQIVEYCGTEIMENILEYIFNNICYKKNNNHNQFFYNSLEQLIKTLKKGWRLLSTFNLL